MKRPEITREEIPKHGLAYGPSTRARILIMRGNGQLIYQGYRVDEYPSKDFLRVTRNGGEAHVCCEDLCDCRGFSYKGDCSHCKIIRAISDVKSIKSAFAWYDSIEGDESYG